MNLKSNNRGMTIVEVIFAAVIGVVILGVVLGTWFFSYRSWTIERMRSKLRINLEIALEKIKEEVRLSTPTYMSLYKPDDSTVYEAISIPLATKDNSGFYTLDDGNIYWDRSIIYHIYDNSVTGDTELRRTEFTDNNDVLTDETQRYNQLVAVVEDGDASGAPNKQNATTDVIFKNLIDLAIQPKAVEFDGYSPSVERSEKITFGSIKLLPGNHTFEFEVVGKNSASSGYELGIDNIFISPSGCDREAELYTPTDSSGDGTTTVGPSSMWSDDYHIEYDSNSIGDFVTFTLYYDEWRESVFGGTSKDNTVLDENNLYIRLATQDEGSVSCWQAAAQTSSNPADFGSSISDVTVRNLISESTLDRDGNMIRVKFVAHSTGDLTINQAWITERATGGGADPYDGTGTAVQLLFDSGNANVLIPAGTEEWSDWTEFAVDETLDYFVTYYISAASETKYWQGGITDTNSFARPGNYAPFNDWTPSGLSPIADSPDLFAVEETENWQATGTATSAAYDSEIDSSTAPAYNQINWTQSAPAGTSVSMEVRGSDNEDMSSATSWTSVANGGSIGGAIDGKRFIQFRTTLSTSSPYTSFPWIDDVFIDWPGIGKICEVGCYFARKPNYGIIKLTVDGQEPTRALVFDVSLYEEFRGQTYEASMTAEVEPRNAGK